MGNFSWDCKVCGESLHRAWEGPRDPDAWQENALFFASNGVTARGKYNGYGKIGSFQIPPEWADAEMDVRMYAGMVRRGEESLAILRAAPTITPEMDALLAKYGIGGGGMREYFDPTAREAEIEKDRQELARIKAAQVEFTVYHRRCWERAGRPGFAGQSKYSRDQGR